MARPPIRSFPSLVLVLALAGPGCGSDLPPVDAPSPGDLRVVLILIDTLRADRLAPHEYPLAVAPFLDELASRSVVFRHAHSTSSWTAPAVASLFTSLQPVQHGVCTGLFISRRLGIEVNRLPTDVTLLPQLFQEAGYATMAVSDNVNVSAKLGFDRGFHRFREMNYQGAQRVAEEALEWVDDFQQRSRTFLYLHFLDPHRPYRAHSPWFESFREREDDRLARYDSEIRHVDAQIADLFERFRWSENTLLVVCSDHGEEFEDHGGDNHGHTLYSELIDVPLILYCPRLWPTGKVVDARVSLVDLLPTFAEICGLELPEEVQGSSLIDLIEGRDIHRPSVYAHLQRRDLGEPPEGLILRSMIFGSRKLITSNANPPQLFDLADDPTEQNDRASDWTTLTAALEEALARNESTLTPHASQAEDIEITDELRKQLEALGYVETDHRP